ncbi:MAG: ABC transporter ATP-binding protein [Candidatus Nanohaloarchaeota archaeon QJJ-9]|nr:ABC transporter ATP-binding protein [Candidatus Nanohaloarchaeota archaeon QJJ-9]
MSQIKLDNVEKHYQLGENVVRALRGAGLSIQEGEFVAVMGPSGSGKSTLLNMLGALDKPTSGKVTIEEEDISKFSRSGLASFRSEKVGFVFQMFNLISSMTAKENVELPMIFRGKSKKERVERAEELLERVELSDRLDFRPPKLSGGQRQRVSIARALANDPDIILADEPTGDLDTETGDKIMDYLTELNDEGKTIILVTHDPHDAEYADRVIDIKDGVTERREGDQS